MVSCGPERPVAAWIDRERLGNDVIPALTLILKSGGCGWNRCLMCGYRHFRYPGDEASLVGLIRGQLRWVEKRFSGQEYRMVKIFTSGSLLDPREVPPDARLEILTKGPGQFCIAAVTPSP